MNSLRYILLIVVTLALVKSQTVTTILENELTQFSFSSNSNITIQLENPPATLGGLLLPCLGAVNVFIGIDGKVNPDQAVFYRYWNKDSQNVGYSLPTTSQAKNITTFVTANQTIAKPIVFQYIVGDGTTYNEKINAKFPIVGDDGKLAIQMTNKGKSASITYTKTDNANDTYQIYKFEGALPEGAFPFTACGVQQYASPITATLQDIGNNKVTATIENLNPNVPTGISIIVSRPGGFNTSYSYAILNDPNSASSLHSSLFIIISALLFTILFGFM